MTRGIDSATIAELAKDSFNLATFVRLEFPAPITITDQPRDVEFDQITWTSSPSFQEDGSAIETSDLRINSTTLVFSGVDQTFVSLFLGSDYMGVRVRIYKACMDNSNSVIGDMILAFDGRIVDYGIADTESTSQVEIEVASHWKDFQKRNGRRTNSNSQQIYFPNDLGFEFNSESVKDIKWGRG